MISVPRPPVEPRPADFRNYGFRRGADIDTIILHTTQGSLESAVAWFADPDSGVSAHYVVGHDGFIALAVEETHAAWHAGNGAVNRRSIGIECEGDCNHPGMWTPELVASLCALCRYLATKYRIPIDRQHVMGHADVPDPRPGHEGEKGGASHHDDPGQYCPWATIFAALNDATTVA